MLQTPYDILTIVWGVIFIAAWIGFIAAMNHLFQTEEREADLRDDGGALDTGAPQHHPLHPAA